MKKYLFYIPIFIVVFGLAIMAVKSRNAHLRDKKCIIVYSSFSGNTHRLAESLSRILKEEYSLIVRKIPVAFFRVFSSPPHDLSDYDLIALGSPVHDTEFCTEMKKYIRNIKGVQDKEVMLFVTYGTGMGRQNALRNQEIMLQQKGARVIKKIAYPGIYTETERDVIDNTVNLFLGATANDSISFPAYIPVMDTYPKETVEVSCRINNRVDAQNEPGGALAIWTKKAFNEGRIADVDIINEFDGMRFAVPVPKWIGEIYLGIVSRNVMGLAIPCFALSLTDSMPVNVQDAPVEDVLIDVVFRKIVLEDPENGRRAFLAEEGMRLSDLIEKAEFSEEQAARYEFIIHSQETDDITIEYLPLKYDVSLKAHDHVLARWKREGLQRERFEDEATTRRDY